MLTPHEIIYLTLFFVLTALGVVAVIFYLRARNLILHNFKSQLEGQYKSMLTEDIFSNTQKIIDTTKYFGLIKASFVFKIFFKLKAAKREVLLGLLAGMHKNLSGEPGDKIKLMYNQLGFINDSYKKLHSRFWEVKITGIRELTEMNVTEAKEEIMPFINDKNVVLRTEAQMAIIRLSPVSDISFLNHLTSDLSTWEQIHILSTILEKDPGLAPDFTQLLLFPNKTIVLFAIKMVDHLREQKGTPVLIELLRNEDPEIRNCAIHALANLDVLESVPILLEIYNEENKENQLEIIRAVGKLGSHAGEIGFLQEELYNSDHEISLAASYALKATGSNGKLLLRKIKKESNDKIAAVIEHSLDERII